MWIEHKEDHDKLPPGMENSATIIPDNFRMNPECPCPTRTCPQHGFCKYCKMHHDSIIRMLAAKGIKAHTVFCKRKEGE